MRTRSFCSPFDARRRILRGLRERFRKQLRNGTGCVGRAMHGAVEMLGRRLTAVVTRVG